MTIATGMIRATALALETLAKQDRVDDEGLKIFKKTMEMGAHQLRVLAEQRDELNERCTELMLAAAMVRKGMED